MQLSFNGKGKIVGGTFNFSQILRADEISFLTDCNGCLSFYQPI
jgi:hypothetical protein